MPKPSCPRQQDHRWKLRDDCYSYVCTLCDEQRYELQSRSSPMPPRIPVRIEMGVGAWQVFNKIHLIAAPHTGGEIIVGDDVISCDKVWIDLHEVRVISKLRFTHPDQMQEYLDKGWSAEWQK